MTTDAFIGWLHDLRYSRLVCMLLPTDAVMGYPIPAVRGGERTLIIPFFTALEEMHQPCGLIAVAYGSERILAYGEAKWLGNAEPVQLFSGDAQSMDAYYSRLAAWEAPDKIQCGIMQQILLDMLAPELAAFYKSVISMQ